MGKKIGYVLFAAFFVIFRLFPLNKKKVFFVATHDDSEEGNIGIVARAIKERMPEYKLVYLTKRDGVRHPFSFFIGKAFQLATSKTVFLDNMFMPMAYTPFSKKAKVVMLWHGTGTIKKFGMDSDTGEVYRLAKKANKRLTHLIVNSKRTKKQYMTAFNMPAEKTHILGLPRTDLLYDEEKKKELVKEFYREYSELADKRLILYAPTFRDAQSDNPQIEIDLEKAKRNLKENEVLMLRLHPFVAGNYTKEDELDGIYNMSSYKGVTTLLLVSDLLITDYSSIIFEYALLDRPMLFYAYDLDDFANNGRDFYEDYEKFVPGKIVKTNDELFVNWTSNAVDKSVVKPFVEDNFEYLDGKCIDRLFELIFDNK